MYVALIFASPRERSAKRTSFSWQCSHSKRRYHCPGVRVCMLSILDFLLPMARGTGLKNGAALIRREGSGRQVETAWSYTTLYDLFPAGITRRTDRTACCERSRTTE